MMMSPKKKIASIIIGKLSEKKEDNDEKPDFVQKMGEVEDKSVPQIEKDDSVATESCAEDMIKAFEKKDPKMLLEAFKNMIDMIKEEKED